MVIGRKQVKAGNTVVEKLPLHSSYTVIVKLVLTYETVLTRRTTETVVSGNVPK